MILPPMTVYSKSLPTVKEAFIAYMGVDCIHSCIVEEQCALLTFKETTTTPALESMIAELSHGIRFVYKDVQYKVDTQYFDI
jgi:hypothetical protein